MEKTGFAMGYDPALTVRDMAALARQAEERGFDMAFFSEALLCNRDSVTALTAFGLATTRIAVGATQVVRLRSPVVMAQTVASLDELTSGRIVLAPGACTEKHARRHGLVPITPALTLREWVESVRQLLAGGKITYKGESVELDQAGLNWSPLRASVPFWIASISRTGLQLAGELGDGVLLDAHTSPEYVENAAKILKDAVRAAGRDWGRFEVAQIIPCSVEDTHDEAVDAVRWEAASRFESPNFPAETERRLRVGEPAINRDDFPMLMHALNTGGKAAVAKALPRALIENTTACGTPDEVLARVARYRRAGVTFPLIRAQARHQSPRLLALFGKP
ncbi:MAG TPA: LLM class flavin-dependent oxidoreductase [Candidatus Methylomirabilis sp.]|nr:LLM class flavin-dependent oxidoreductase [Candidatus Methylomirabilis sp.]